MASIHASIPVSTTRQVSSTKTTYTILYEPPTLPSGHSQYSQPLYKVILAKWRSPPFATSVQVDSESWDILPEPVPRHTLSPVMTGTEVGPTIVLHSSPRINKEHLIGLIPSNVILYSGVIAFERCQCLHIAAESIELFHNYSNPHTYNLRSRSFHWEKQRPHIAQL
ncbi:hypothetical protein PGT21_034399 [Puccinia graminis f. sp. tritici]|uniref:Uncharacterized protein n=1 Tax=Puccinia graminis f. sp. tritici TaxID=56615 RepID=A0A5B0QCH3_PUCGR|nr:hypothetical protein PGT21_034399 [Puccinia graminis f. sp. tritici]